MRLSLVFLVLLVAAPVSALPDWITGMAAHNPDDIAVLIYKADTGEPVGTANPDSHGRERAVTIGDVIRFVVNARQDREPLSGRATVTIRQGSVMVASLDVSVVDGQGEALFTIPADWGGNYHVEALFAGLQDAQNEFKVKGYKCVPEEEQCDGVDNDCDGIVDDVDARACGQSDVGVCQRGLQECKRGSWTECKGIMEPEPELCDGADNDCDGLSDEGMERVCGSNTGQCRQGTQVCAAGAWGACDGSVVGPSEEVCDGIDNDCDGLSDEGVSCDCAPDDTRACGSAEGQCKVGVQRCESGSWGACQGGTQPAPEVCDGIDNDCDGRIDEDVTSACGVSNVGQCRLGAQSCDAGNWGRCEGAINPSDEVCDGIDNDCDGQTDESITRACGAGGCLRGTQSCEDGRWTQCTDSSGPQPELCDGRDNDCNGVADDLAPRACGCDCADAKVLFVRDTGHHNEDIEDFDYTLNLLRRQDVKVTVIDEPYGGLKPSDSQGYDLVWFVNPGWPMDTKQTLQTLLTLYDEGWPIVLQGDDMTWGADQLKQGDLEQLTHLHNINNGLDQNYDVAFENSNHPLLRYLRGESFLYDNDDIDTTTVADGDVTVLARGFAVGKQSHGGPAVIVRDNTADGKGILLVKLLTLNQVRPQWQAEALVGSIVNWLLNKADRCVCGATIGACKQSTQSCTDGAWGACEGVPPIHEVCNGVDDDCNGRSDDGIVCDCLDGETEACGTDIGECVAGSRQCQGGGWGQCVGTVLPAPEICDGKDNDCDGQVDEDIIVACGGSMVAPCKMGVRYCVEGELGPCQGAIEPQPESCDGVDNNCDGQTDENHVCECDDGDTRACPAIGGCSGGVQRCDNGLFGECQGAATPQPEICNGVDDDCDGQADEDLVQACGSAVGQCGQGSQRCAAGVWGACLDATLPGREVCDGVDNDCDGLTDNGIGCACQNGQTRQCGKDEGVCAYGVQACWDGAWGGCKDGVEPQVELCDGLDNDCNGIVDDIEPRACGVSDVGACRLGQQRCVEGEWSACRGDVEPGAEVCDGIDNDCNGATDEGCKSFTPAIIPQRKSHIPASSGKAIVSEKDRQRAQLQVDIIAAPPRIAAVDQRFGVQAIVRNVGDSTLPNVVADASSSAGWIGESVPVGTLEPNESRIITVAFRNTLCPDADIPLILLPDDALLVVKAHSGEVADNDNVTRPVSAPPLGVVAKPLGDRLRTCLFIDNNGRPARHQLEVELEVYDQKKDAIIDLLSPVRVGADQAVIAVNDYPLAAMPTSKIYHVRANMYEGGRLFESSYHVAEARSTVDLSTIRIPARRTLWDAIKELLGVA